MHLCLQVSIGLQGGDRYKASFLPGTEGPAEERACQSSEPEGEDQIVWFFFFPVEFSEVKRDTNVDNLTKLVNFKDQEKNLASLGIGKIIKEDRPVSNFSSALDDKNNETAVYWQLKENMISPRRHFSVRHVLLLCSQTL